MNLENNAVIHSFRVVRQTALPELGAVMYVMEHEPTGLHLAWLDREDENRTFNIVFRTLPWNDTGVFHILEHSVLCGSDRYPVKEPFVELVKNSMNTFLNAMTFPDKTAYPVCSTNNKDFINLMRVYMDAVLHPAIYRNPKIFQQEGWHYAFDEAGNPTYKGVVFNEMKGAMANADEALEDAINQAIMPDTPYRYNSGGDPKHIPDLSYEEFIETHRKFYSPSNAYVFLDGNIDIDEVLGILHDEYLKDYGRTEPIPLPPKQAPVNGGSRVVTYEISEEEKGEPRHRIVWAGVVGDYGDRERLLAVHVLHSVIAHNNHSPLPKLILDRGLAEDVIVSMMDSVMQPYAKIEVRNCEEKNLDEIRKLIFDELRRLADEGLDHDEIESTLINTEFLMRERDFASYPLGLVYSFNVIENWTYGGEPEANLQIEDYFDHLRQRIGENYFEQLIREVYLDNPHFCEVILAPSETAGEERRQEEAVRLRETAAAWTEEERRAYREAEKELDAWQNQEDSPEALQCLPHLTLADIQDMPEQIPTEVLDVDGTTVLLHDIQCNGIIYVNAFFDITDATEDELAWISFLTETLGKLDTKTSTAMELLRRCHRYCGGLSFTTSAFTRNNSATDYGTKLIVTFSTLRKNLEEAVKLVAEILTATDFADEDAVRKLLMQDRGEMQQDMAMAGHSLGIRRLTAMYTAAGVVNECTDGLTYYEWMKSKEQSWNPAEFLPKLESSLRGYACEARMTLSLTGGNAEDAAVLAALFRKGLAPNAESAIPASDYRVKPWGKRKEGIVIPADVAFAVRGGNICEYGSAWTGELSLAARIISYAYLWNVIRVQGGAYGSGLTAGTSGLVACYSYRDPSGAKSLETYTSVGDFLTEFAKSEPDLTGFIIGAVSESSRVMSPRLKATAGDSLYLSGRTYEDRCRERRRVLNSTPESLAQYAAPLAEAIREGGIVIAGGRNQIDACEGLDRVITV